MSVPMLLGYFKRESWPRNFTIWFFFPQICPTEENPLLFSSTWPKFYATIQIPHSFRITTSRRWLKWIETQYYLGRDKQAFSGNMSPDAKVGKMITSQRRQTETLGSELFFTVLKHLSVSVGFRVLPLDKQD